MQPATRGVVSIMRAAMESPALFCRVRMEAALALAATAGTEHNGALSCGPFHYFHGYGGVQYSIDLMSSTED